MATISCPNKKTSIQTGVFRPISGRNTPSLLYTGSLKKKTVMMFFFRYQQANKGRKFQLTGSLLLLFLSGTLSAAENTGDFHIWNTNSVKGSLTEKWTLSFANKNHISTQLQAIDLSYYEMVAGRSLNPWLSTAIGYRNLFSKKATNWNEEQRLMVYLSYKGTKGKLYARCSMRLSYRWLQNSSNNMRYYNKLTIGSSLKAGTLKLSPYLAEESFVLLNSQAFHMARVFAGCSIHNNSPLAFDFYFGRHYSKANEQWSYYQLAGLGLSFTF
ncbi:hypothetical protein FHS86_002775 [Roseimarinus sediminis]